MSEHRALLIESAAGLAIDNGRLRIRRKDRADSFVLPADIAVLVLHHPAILLSGHVLQALAEAGAMVLVNDAQHLPLGMLQPWKGRSVVVRRLRKQIALDDKTAKGLWRIIVDGKIATQANTLRILKLNGALGLERLRQKIKDGDPENVEAQAARYYWRYILPKDAKRHKRGAEDGINARLNFGYAVLRALVAREIAVAGLTPALGVGHQNVDNAFNLADDLMEPYRCMVDRQVMSCNYREEFNAAARVESLNFLSAEIAIGKQHYRLPAAISETVKSYVRILNNHKEKPALPEV